MTDDERVVRAFECGRHGTFVETNPISPVGLYAACPECNDNWCMTENITIEELRDRVNEPVPEAENETITAEEALQRIEGDS